jgi:putative tryptophan/tyrosine transport system substrate-binding protein
MRRRQFIAGLGSVAAWPVAARAQQAGVPVIAVLWLGGPRVGTNPTISAAFRQGLAEAGYVPDRNVAFELRLADFPSFLPRLAAELVDRKPAVIVTGVSPYAAVAAKAATSTIPIVFVMVSDPMTHGLVASFSQPGGNLTGVTSLTTELVGKRLNLLVELVPQATKIGYLSISSDSPVFEDAKNEMLAAGRAMGREIIVGEVRRDFEPAFAAFLEREARAVMVGAFAAFHDARNSAKILELATRHRIPAMYPDRLYPLNGGLMSYASSDTELLRQAGIYTGRIIKGESPANLPVFQPTKFQFVLNLKTAKALGLTIPETLLATADEVIQ